MAAHHQGVPPELGCVGDYNFLWSGVLLRAVMDYICLVEPIGFGIANGIRLKSEDLDGILGVGESIGNAQDFHVARKGSKEVILRSGFLASQFAGDIELRSPAGGKSVTHPAAILKAGTVLKTGVIIEVRPAGG